VNVSNKTNKFIWIPRMLAIVFILFLSLFALDTFSGEDPLYIKISAFFIHLIPSFVLLVILIISRKHPLYSGLVFIFLSIVFTLFFKTYNIFSYFLIISFPLIVIGALFIIYHVLEKRKSA